jgi:hypothetical protein
MKILFYNPTTVQKRFVPYEAIRGSSFFRRPNYDAMRLAYLSQHHEFYYYDERVEDKPHFEPDVVVANVSLTLSRYVENTIRKLWKKAHTICYGFYPTLFPKKTAAFADTVVIGDIANIWHLILEHAQGDALLPLYSSNREDRFGVERSLEVKRGFTPLLSQFRTQFGCACSSEYKDFCYEHIIYKHIVQRDIEDAVKDISCTRRKMIFIRDDDFLNNIEYALSLLERCWRFKKMWLFQTGKSVLERAELFPFFRDHGVRIIWLKEDWLGTDIRSSIENKEYVKEKKHEIVAIHNNRIAVGCMLRLGYPGEDFLFYRRLLHFLSSTRIDLIKVAVQTPMPDTLTYRQAMRDRLLAEDYTLYDQWMPVVQIPGTAPQALYTWMEWLRDSFYSWDSIVRRSVVVSPKLGVYNTMLFYLMPNLSYRDNFLEKVGYPP